MVMLGVSLLSAGVCVMLDAWVGFSVMVALLSFAVVAVASVPFVRTSRALDNLYRLADTAVWRGDETVSSEEVAEEVESAMMSEGEVRRADWARYRAWRAGESTEEL